MKVSKFFKMWDIVLLIIILCFSGTGCSTPGTRAADNAVLPVIGQHYIKIENQTKLISGIMPEMTNDDFWLKGLNNSEDTIMTGEEIKVFNQKIIDEMPEIYDLKAYSTSLKKEELTGFIREYNFSGGTIGEDGKILPQDFFDQIQTNINLSEIKDSNSVLYGITIRKCNLRTFPTDAAVYNSTSNRLDRFQETGCPLGEPLLILHESKDHQWAFVQLYNYRGWMNKENIAVAKDKKQLFDYAESKDFLIAVDQCVIQNPASKEEIKLVMGSRMKLLEEGKDYYKVAIPNRDRQGRLIFSNINIAKNECLSKGYLGYTHSNIIKQAFKLLGTSYDWGGKEYGYDCSSYIMSIYRTMGIQLPRNSGQQARTPGIALTFSRLDTMEQRMKNLEKLKPGAALYMPGHIMLYLGSYEGNHYIIHDFMGYWDTGFKYIPIDAVAISSVMINDDYGTQYLMMLTSALEFKLN